MQIMAYGGSKPVPFQQASCESQALEPGITGEFTIQATQAVVDATGCNATDVQSAATIECLRSLSKEKLLHGQLSTAGSGPGKNVGDQWLPVIDGDFVPAAPSQLIAQKRFANVTTMIGWCEDDGTFFVPRTLHNNRGVYNWFRHYQPGMTPENVRQLLSLYPVSDFAANPAANLTAQVYRAGRILRDILFTCQPMHYGQALAEAGNDVYLWTQNETMMDEILVALDVPGAGVIHTSNFAYQFGNLSHYNVDGFPYRPNHTDFVLRNTQSRSWASFVSYGTPSHAKNTLQGWTPAFKQNNVDIYVVGGPSEGLSAYKGANAAPAVVAQKLSDRCGFLNSPEIIKQLQY